VVEEFSAKKDIHFRAVLVVLNVLEERKEVENFKVFFLFFFI